MNKKLKPYMKCPKCKSDELVCTERRREEKHIEEDYHCYGCCFEWTERYKLILVSIKENYL